MESVLVIDTPKSCSECKLSFKGMRICLPLGEYCHKGEIHPQCPLKQLPSKEETDMMKHWCEVGILKEAHEFQINGSGFNSTITRMDNFFNTIYGDNK